MLGGFLSHSNEEKWAVFHCICYLLKKTLLLHNLVWRPTQTYSAFLIGRMSIAPSTKVNPFSILDTIDAYVLQAIRNKLLLLIFSASFLFIFSFINCILESILNTGYCKLVYNLNVNVDKYYDYRRYYLTSLNVGNINAFNAMNRLL